MTIYIRVCMYIHIVNMNERTRTLAEELRYIHTSEIEVSLEGSHFIEPMVHKYISIYSI